MSLLPGMKIVGRSTLSEIVQDQSFSESMKQLNHDSDRYQWDILGFKFQRAEPTAIQTNWGDYDISFTSQPYWALEMDGDHQEISQEFNINFQEGTVKVPPSQTEMPISLQGFRKHSLFTYIPEEGEEQGYNDYNLTQYSTNISLNSTTPVVNKSTWISTGYMTLKDHKGQEYSNNLSSNHISIYNPDKEYPLIPPYDIQVLSMDEQNASEVIFSDSTQTKYVINPFLIAGGFSELWSIDTVFQVKGLLNTYYDLFGIEILSDSTTISSKTIIIPKTVQYIKVQENGSILLTNSTLKVSYCSYLSTIASIDGNSSGSRIVLTTNQINKFSSRITTVGDRRFFDGVLEVEEEENR